MIDHLIRWSLRHRAIVVSAAVVACAIGARTAFRLPVDVFPDLTAPTVTVLTEAHGMAPLDLEQQVTFPIETALNGASGVRRVRSSTVPGLSIVWAEFEWDENQRDARIIVSERLALAAEQLPEGVHPVLAPVTSIMGEILLLGLRAEDGEASSERAEELRTYAETQLRRRLLSVPGVAQVAVIGGDLKQYQVVLETAKLTSYDVSLDAVRAALQSDNRNVSAGFLNTAGSEYIVSGRGRFRTVDDIGSVVIREAGSVPIRVRDLGRVVIGSAPKRGVGSIRGESAVVLTVMKQPQANTLEVTREIDRVLDGIETRLDGIVLERNIFRQSDFIARAVKNVTHALRDGGILVVVIMLLFLANLRATAITLTAIPLSLVAAVIVLEAFGATINTMTLGGMAIAIGALVDDAVIDVENVIRRLRENSARPPPERRSALTVVFLASKEIRSSITFATFIVIVVFVPVFFLPGVESRLLEPLGIAYVVSISASLVVALTVTPALCLILLPSSRSVRDPREPRLARTLKNTYGVCLRWILRHPLLVTGPALALFLAAAVQLALFGRTFLPDFNEGALTINATTLPGISLRESDALGRWVEKRILAQPEVTTTTRRTGRAELDEHAQGTNGAEIDVPFTLGERSKTEFLAALRSDLAQIPGTNIEIGQPISHRIDHMLSGTRANLAVKIFGPDLYELRRVGERIRVEMESIEGVVDLALEQQSDVPVLSIDYDREALARYGVTVQDVSAALEAAVQGLTVTQVLEGRASFAVVVKLRAREEWSIENLGRLLIDTSSGVRVPLATVASIQRDKGPNAVSRENVERKIVVQANIAGRDITSVVAGIRARVEPIIRSYPSYRVEYSGQFESAEEAGAILLVLGGLVVIAIGFLLHLAFASVRDALFVMTNLPLALIGAVGGVFLSGGTLSVASMIGFITVFGIATRNGIMLVSHVRHLQRQEGVDDFREAVYRGSVERLLPILMTAIGTALALVPIVIAANKPGNEIQTPMAAVILCGLVSATFLNMVVVPALFLRFGTAQTRRTSAGEES